MGNRLNKYISDYVVFDLETTGTSCVSDDVIEISGVKVVDGEVVDEFSALVNPGRPIPFYASAVNGITDEMVADCPEFGEVLEEFLAFAGDMTLVGHNIHTFDMRFLCRDAERLLGKTVDNDYVDTLQMARAYLPWLKKHRLTDLAEYYGISAEGAHRALADCRMNRTVFERIGEEIDNPSKESAAYRKCPRCGGALKRRNGKYGEFMGCLNYPECRYTEDV